MGVLSGIRSALLHLAFPHICEGCGNDLVQEKELLCLRCLTSLPQTGFHMYGNNPVEKVFWGRLPVTHAFSHYYFTKSSLIQRLMHSFKYRGNRELGIYLGKQMGFAIESTNRFSDLQALVPLPLFHEREHKRGFNQAALLCEGIASVLHLPVLKESVIRVSHTETQTKKGRMERWQNMEGRFSVCNSSLLEERHILLVDDVLTTGATLEACGRALITVPGIRLSIATLCYSSGL